MEDRDAGVQEGLFDRLAEGDAAALEAVCRLYGERAAGMVRHRLGKSLRMRLETADVVQEAMMDVVQEAKRIRFRGEADFLRWLNAVVEHRILQAARYWSAQKRKAGLQSPLATDDLQEDPRAERPSRIYRRRETSDRISGALAGLPEKHRKVLIPRLILQMPWPAVARSLKISLEAAQMRFLRARRALARALSGLQGEEG